MPHESADRLSEGVRLARGGLLDKALQQLAGATEHADPLVMAESLRHQADIHRTRCEWDRAIALARQSAHAAREAGSTDALAEALNAEAAVHLSRGAFAEARPLLLRMVELSPAPRIRGIALQNLGFMAAEEGHHAEARGWFDRSLHAFHQARYARGIAVALLNSGRIALLGEDAELAEGLSSAAVAAARGVDDLDLLALSCLNLAEALLRLDQLEQAERYACEALGHFDSTRNDWRRAECFRLLGDIHIAEGDARSARRCYRTGLELARRIDTPLEAARLEERLAQVPDNAGER